jgi:hypothetical protein
VKCACALRESVCADILSWVCLSCVFSLPPFLIVTACKKKWCFYFSYVAVAFNVVIFFSLFWCLTLMLGAVRREGNSWVNFHFFLACIF